MLKGSIIFIFLSKDQLFFIFVSKDQLLSTEVKTIKAILLDNGPKKFNKYKIGEYQQKLKESDQYNLKVRSLSA